MVAYKSRSFYFFKSLILPLACFLLGYFIVSFFDHSSPKITSIASITNITNEKVKSDLLSIVILSAVVNDGKRKTCRETWLSLSNSSKHWFVIGTSRLDSKAIAKLNKEKEKYHDLLLLPDHVDIKRNLTPKVVASLKFVHETTNAKFVLKTDDDSFVRLDFLENELSSLVNNRSIYWGYFAKTAPILHSGPFKETKWFVCDKYLPYAGGGGYILSNDLVEYIATHSKKLQPYVNEDVTIGMWMSPLIVTRIHDSRFNTFSSRGCSNSHLLNHHQTPVAMRRTWKIFKEAGKMCWKERFFYGHSYNWKTIPSKCCEKFYSWSFNVSSW